MTFFPYLHDTPAVAPAVTAMYNTHNNIISNANKTAIVEKNNTNSSDKMPHSNGKKRHSTTTKNTTVL